jgi:hypothetical protein
MATTKKKTTSKKSSNSKNANNSARPWSWRFSFLTIGIHTITVMTLVVGALFASSTFIAQHNQTRLAKINSIYSSFKLDDSYQVKDVNVFGDKRIYSYDKGRTFSSKIDYIHGDTVSNTVAKLDEKIKAVGFTFVGEPYPGTGSTQYHYKSSNGEYIRLTVSSKPYDDALTNAYVLEKDTSSLFASSDKNAAPSNIVIKVNLDDNNE